MSESVSSYSGSFARYDEEKTTRLYRNINKTLGEIAEVAAEVNSNYGKLEKNINRTAQLITAIQTGKQKEAAATAAVSMT